MPSKSLARPQAEEQTRGYARVLRLTKWLAHVPEGASVLSVTVADGEERTTLLRLAASKVEPREAADRINDSLESYVELSKRHARAWVQWVDAAGLELATMALRCDRPEGAEHPLDPSREFEGTTISQQAQNQSLVQAMAAFVLQQSSEIRKDYQSSLSAANDRAYYAETRWKEALTELDKARARIAELEEEIANLHHAAAEQAAKTGEPSSPQDQAMAEAARTLLALIASEASGGGGTGAAIAQVASGALNGAGG